MSTDSSSKDPQQPPQKPQSLWDTVASVGAAFFGVQSNKNRQRDFTKGKASHFIAVGIAMTLVFILVIYVAVKLVLRNAGM